MLDMSCTVYYEITLSIYSSFLLSVGLSICLLLSFLKIGSSVFSDIVHDDIRPWYLVTDRTRYLKQNFGGPNLRQNQT